MSERSIPSFIRSILMSPRKVRTMDKTFDGIITRIWSRKGYLSITILLIGVLVFIGLIGGIYLCKNYQNIFIDMRLPGFTLTTEGSMQDVDLDDPKNISHIMAHINSAKYDHPLLRKLRSSILDGNRKLFPKDYNIMVTYSEDVSKGYAKVCRMSEFYGNRVRLFDPAAGSTIELKGFFGLDHDECDKRPNRRIEVDVNDKDKLKGKEIGIVAQTLPNNYTMIPVVPKENSVSRETSN